jgi:hypothetical protein
LQGTDNALSALSNSDLRDKALDIAYKILEASSEYRAKSNELMYSDRWKTSSAISTSENYLAYSRLSDELASKYNAYKADAILYRDEIISRLAKRSQQGIVALDKREYENPVNPIGMERVAADLQQLAKQLPNKFNIDTDILSPATR